MIDTAKENGVKLMEGFMYRYTDKTMKVQDIIRSGKLGSIKYVYACFRFLLDRENTIKEKANLGGGALYDVGVYPINYLSLITDQVASTVSVEAYAPNEVDVNFAGTIKYPDGLVAQIACGFNAYNRTYSEIIGEKGMLIIEDPFLGKASELILKTKEGIEVFPTEESDRYFLEVEAFTSVLLGKNSKLISLDQTLNNTQLLERLYKLI